jgi:hypothetical protein
MGKMDWEKELIIMLASMEMELTKEPKKETFWDKVKKFFKRA